MRPEASTPVPRYRRAFPPESEVADLPAAATFSVAPGVVAIVYASVGEGGVRRLWVKLRGKLES
jgi:hypothetical protein